MTLVWCSCTGFVLWYTTNHRVCTCGHRDSEHIDGFRSCMGDCWIDKETQE